MHVQIPLNVLIELSTIIKVTYEMIVRVKSRGVRLPEGHLVRIPLGAIKRRLPSGERAPLYKKKVGFPMK